VDYTCCHASTRGELVQKNKKPKEALGGKIHYKCLNSMVAEAAGWLGVWCLVFPQGCLDLRFAGESINDGGLLSCHMGRAGREGQSLIQLNSRYFCVNPQSAISLASGVRFVRFIRSFNKKPLLPAGPAHLNIPLAPL
jgi:hypothetical protein